jgi:hypothetical protein
VPSRERWRARRSGGERLTPPIVIYIGRGGDSRDGSAHGDWLACFGCLALPTLRRAFSRARRVRSVGGGWPQSEARRASVSRRAIQRHADESPASTVEDGDDGIRVRHAPSEQAQNDQERPDGGRVPRATGLCTTCSVPHAGSPNCLNRRAGPRLRGARIVGAAVVSRFGPVRSAMGSGHGRAGRATARKKVWSGLGRCGITCVGPEPGRLSGRARRRVYGLQFFCILAIPSELV